ncbi:MAG: CusA/CzcA family heavy metal efflux RND transporter [Bacteroidia bacterium]|nr:CusA/CzcA family heavy metal efflux RND transporter [Bacteroidia bacterium]
MLDKIIAFSVKNKLVIAIMTLALIVWGVWSASKLPIDALPDITNNQVQIITRSPTLAAQEVEQFVTYPIEKTLANLPDVMEIRSFSRFGLSVITIVFEDDVNIYFARQLIGEKLKQAEKEINPSMGKPELAPITTGLGEIYQYVIHPKKGSENKYSSMDLRVIQDWIVARQLNGIKGVAEITGFGGLTKQYEVSVDPDRLKAMGVSIPEIFDALSKNNENTGGAYIDKKPNAYFIRGIGMVKSFADIENIVVKYNPNSTPILIKNIARVQYGSPPRYGAMTYNGEKEVVGGIVLMLKGANSSSVVTDVKSRMTTIQASLPEDVIIEPFLDRTDLVNRAISTVERNLIEGALIVIFVLILFLGNFRAGLIVATAIPLSLLFALGLMNVFGVSANLMSLGAIDFGLIVDGAVIIVEATMHHLGLRKSIARLTQSEMDDEVFQSASKIRSSAAFGEIIILIVYIPILTLIGIEGKMFRPMAQTVGFSIFGALILSLTYIPMMCALFLSKNISQKRNFSDRMMTFLQNIYQPILQKAIQFKYLIISFTVMLFIVSILVFNSLGGEFIPTLEEGDYAIEFTLPQGTSLSQTIETVMQAERIIKEFPEVKMVVGKTGAADIATDPMPMEASDLIVILKDKSEWKTTNDFYELADKMKEKLNNIPGVIAEPSQPIQMRFNELMSGIKQDVAIKIFGENLDTLNSYANKVANSIKSINGISLPQIERISGLPQINIEYDRGRLALYGLNISDINQIVTMAFAGETAGSVFENERKFNLVIRLDSNHRSSLEDVNNLFIPTPDGNQIPLSQVASVSFKEGPAQISREDGKRRVYISFNVHDRDVQSVVEDIQVKLNKDVKLPSGYYYTYGGTFENLQRASKRLMIAVPIALLLIFVLLYFTFSSFKQAGLIFTAIPMSAIGGIFALLIRDMPFSISAGIGFIALFGVAVLNGIVLIGTFNQLEKDGWDDVLKRVIEGTRIRLRPVLMTALVASLGFLPMALSHSAGAEVQKPLASVVIGGLVTATFLTLFVLPLLYIIINSKNMFKVKIKTAPVITLFVALLLTSSNLMGQSNTGVTEYSLDEITNYALKNNPTVQAQNLNVQSGFSNSKSYFDIPKLRVNMQTGQYNSINNDRAFQVSQDIPFPTVFHARSALYKAQLKGNQMERESAINELKSHVNILYYNLLFLQNEKTELMSLDSTLRLLVTTATKRYKAGDMKLLDKTIAEIKYGELQLLIQTNNSQFNATYSSLKSLMNINSEFTVSAKTLVPIEFNGSTDTSLLSDNPQLKLLWQNAEIAGRAKKLQSAEVLPDFSIGYFNQSLIGVQSINNSDVYFNKSKRFTGLNVGINIPLTFASSNQKIKSMELQKQSLIMEAESAKINLQNMLQTLLIEYGQVLNRYNYYKNTALASADLIEKTAEISYTNADIKYKDYLEAIQTASSIRIQYLQSVQQMNETIIKINYLINK